MKTKRLIVVAILLIAGSLSTELFAQDAIKALVQKCENMENVNVNIVRNRNKETRKVERTITSISFSNNEALVNEFIAAFNKDKEMTDQEIENRSNGKVNNIFYRFGNTSYSFTQGEEGSGSISIIERSDNKKDVE
ncbi:putative membrane-anchored protein [Parabacteroides sp. PF5-5]|uniref:DUF5024 domain-containing protein n=1 Tax=unclassified Parabacteroides TaxID=2649774 RepID=UPI00247530A7|nr:MULTISPECIES: DUF5024 domain-containing protein [unclassified Parabacteroides]MDH6306505.1 putative membrane-anchored protein [Parabacteroides sp. PH5-39]MDH6317472.1 putative membrane-anchored protein [Parabacteroides sp. PF5-13]MDH6321225.1 putative membrane-anchored protein [Parabacteroides sp. PH5-13]MDH6324957.1 putative membrane-anchored protein [Parabacteroides sp. PH5-8]MDH6328666.1 putative membrane-anchored protein [Parabacteroides sp. PH5-41]